MSRNTMRRNPGRYSRAFILMLRAREYVIEERVYCFWRRR
jgi:hypothetical protein